jgi:hypothetical protein
MESGFVDRGDCGRRGFVVMATEPTSDPQTADLPLEGVRVESADPAPVEHETGEEKARQNRQEDPPA